MCACCLVRHGGCLWLCSWGGCWRAATKKHPMWESQGGEERQDPFPQHQFLPGRGKPLSHSAVAGFSLWAAGGAKTPQNLPHGCFSLLHPPPSPGQHQPQPTQPCPRHRALCLQFASESPSVAQVWTWLRVDSAGGGALPQLGGRKGNEGSNQEHREELVGVC